MGELPGEARAEESEVRWKLLRCHCGGCVLDRLTTRRTCTAGVARLDSQSMLGLLGSTSRGQCSFACDISLSV